MDDKKNGEPTNDQPSHEGLHLPLLQNGQRSLLAKQPKTRAQKAVRKVFKGTAHLANLLPSGTVLIFHVMSPILTHEGKCESNASRALTLGFLGACAVTCFLLCFTDSFRDINGKVRYGLATLQGLLVIDGSGISLTPEEARKFRIRLSDFFHAWMSVIVFAAVAISDENVMNCFFPSPSVAVQEAVKAVPVVVGTMCSAIFVVFPTERHGIGFPISRQ